MCRSEWRLRAGWRLWLSYALGMLIFPLVFLADRVGGGDACYIVMQAPAEEGAQGSEAQAGERAD